MRYKRLSQLGKELYFRFIEDDVPALGAQVTYYLLLSFFPFLIFLITLISYTPLTSDVMLGNLSYILPRDAYEAITGAFRQTVNARSRTLLSFSMAAAIWASSNGILAMIRGINKAYDQKETRPFWKTRGISILFTIALAVLILLTLLILVFGETLGEYIFFLLGFSYLFNVSWDIIRFIAALAILTLVFIFIYRWMPNCRLSFIEVLPGSVFSTAGWILISLAFSYYVNNFTYYSNMYGSIGGIIVLLLWLYWSSVIILLGGEINATLARVTSDKCGNKKKAPR